MGEWEYGNNMEKILLNGLLDAGIFLWFQKKYGNHWFWGVKLGLCFTWIAGGTLVLNRLPFDTFLYRIFFSFVIYILLFLFVSEKSVWKEGIRRTFMLMAGMMIPEFCVSVIVMAAAGNYDLEWLMTETLAGDFSFLIARVVEIFILQMENDIFSEETVKKKRVKWYIFWSFSALVYLYIVIYCFIQEKVDASVLGMAFTANVVFLIFIFILYFGYLHTVKKVEFQKKEIELLREKNRNQVEGYQEINSLHQQVRKIYHDLKNHVLIADGMQTSELKEMYLEDLESYFSEYLLKPDSGNEILDVLIQKKHEICRKKQIQFEYNVDFSKGAFINLVDVGTIFGNIIDNAIEACEQMEESKRRIDLFVGSVEMFIVIKVSNPFLEVRKVGKQLFSMKRRFDKPGVGLVCLEDTLKKYEGTFRYEIKDSLFEITIMIPVRQ